jgi:hypothetical protein
VAPTRSTSIGSNMFNGTLQPTSPPPPGGSGSAPRDRLPNVLLSPAGLAGGDGVLSMWPGTAAVLSEGRGCVSVGVVSAEVDVGLDARLGEVWDKDLYRPRRCAGRKRRTIGIGSRAIYRIREREGGRKAHYCRVCGSHRHAPAPYANIRTELWRM